MICGHKSYLWTHGDLCQKTYREPQGRKRCRGQISVLRMWVRRRPCLFRERHLKTVQYNKKYKTKNRSYWTTTNIDCMSYIHVTMYILKFSLMVDVTCIICSTSLENYQYEYNNNCALLFFLINFHHHLHHVLLLRHTHYNKFLSELILNESKCTV